ncbi:forkhead domain-containing [Trichoderma arundinaceum]|uniref:Forkhead domain-containing n=1 Tax=Trichoderma arundinaceum TaxID=490622 RepID=A0A395NBT8_TRIAR|nr:forkhead domain-containing [Trichoderma arundinaceum]
MDSYTDFRHPQSAEQSVLMACCSSAALSILPSGFGQGQQHHQPDTSSFTPAVCELPEQQQRRRQQHQQEEELQDPHGRRLLSPPTCCTEPRVYMSPYLSYQSRIWPSPPLGPGDIQSRISFQDSPICGSAHLPCYTDSPTSPGGWSSGSRCPPLTVPCHSQISGDQPFVRFCTPMSGRDLPSQHSDMSTPYAESFHPESDVEMTADLKISMPSYDGMANSSAVPDSSSVGSPSPDGLQAETPASLVAPKIELVDNHDAELLESILAAPSSAAPSTAEPIPASSVKPDERADEPYAKLIYKALMSRPDYTMTLQELYQWFRENTSKANNEKGGWQNSIRHNLSMNAAFKRRDRKRLDGAALPASTEGESPSEPKRANEWILEDWAVRDGVQSTTRYRKGNSGRRSSRRSAMQSNVGTGRRGSQRNSSVRALSGQKGGCAARNSRVRNLLYNQGLTLAHGRQYRLIEGGLDSPPSSSMPNPFYSMPIGIPRIDPTAIHTPIAHGHNAGADFGPADTASTELFGLQMTGPRMGQPVAGGGSGHSGIHSVSYMGQQEQMYLAPSPAEFPYGIADVHLDYDGDHAGADVVEQIRRYESMAGAPRIGWDNPHGM